MKNVLVTGGSRGIGESISRLFAENGHRVFVNFSNRDEKALALTEEIKAIPYKCDVSKFKLVDMMVNDIYNKYGGIDILVNNAGIAQQKLFTDITEEEWDTMFDVNIKSMFNTSKAVLPYMINKKCGKIINVSSMWGVAGASCEVHYSASKAAVIGFTKSLAKEVGLSGIQVNCVAPGVIDTEMNSHLTNDDIQLLKEETPTGTIGKPDDIANTIFFLASEKADFITGQIISVNGGIII